MVGGGISFAGWVRSRQERRRDGIIDPWSIIIVSKDQPQEDYNPREGLGPTLFETQMLRKKLWLRIARHVVENGHQIHK